LKTLSGVKRISGGKTLKIDLVVVDDVLKDIVISGDFFAHPENAIDDLENELRGKRLSDIDSVFEKYRGLIVLIGVSLEDIKSLIHELISGEAGGGYGWRDLYRGF